MTTSLAPAVLIIGDNFELRFEVEEIEGEFAERARKELRETPENKSEAIEELRKLVTDDKNLNFPVDDELRLLIFLRPCKFYAQSAYALMKRYYTFRLKNPKVYRELKPTNEKNLFDQDIITVLPKRDQFGRRVMLIESGGKWNTSLCSVDEIFRGCALFLEAAMAEPKTQVSGVVVILDQAGLSLSHVMQFTPGFARAVVTWVQECLPIRLKGVHIVNQPYIFNMIFAIFKPFLQEKLRKRIHFHGTNRPSLLKHIDPEVLPKRYGGTLDLPDVTGDQWYTLMAPRNSDYEKVNSFGYTS
ncbi:clavesin-1-like [Neocloeon triangulifer]|uniref:clavesin-1-like n=1 Tax=Neocloeon triangulifer TaxID=2078957 RepID=UPI00286F0936|nr:clavesin-1-like [Neocloeon triangulifer]XP_059484487.1 clavesin-1-like [Neocloeon triangulifer]XP_059484488.1 clavesin-1-like [Neocloeon triangulifer]XP_059484489.1 clavesin-1-like [Neocloeon triangulifer]XP_059484490.1 clavesin-1-like [Neocloeon triangulifer]